MSRPVLTIGNFDGVHRGHRALVTRTIALAKGYGDRSCAMFFSPHPGEIVAAREAPLELTTPGRRRQLLSALGIDEVIVQPFTKAFSTLSPEAFATEFLMPRINPRHIVVGGDFRFGARRAGDLCTLTKLGEDLGFEVEEVAPVYFGEKLVSSSRVRSLLQAGKVREAAELLERPHDLLGTVVKGQAKGRLIGFPTANLDSIEGLCPADGVYAVVAEQKRGQQIAGVANLGVRPTLKAGRSLEVHLFNFDRDIYGETLQVSFVERIRGERSFPSIDALKAQITEDAAKACAILQVAKDPSML